MSESLPTPEEIQERLHLQLERVTARNHDEPEETQEEYEARRYTEWQTLLNHTVDRLIEEKKEDVKDFEMLDIIGEEMKKMNTTPPFNPHYFIQKVREEIQKKENNIKK